MHRTMFENMVCSPGENRFFATWTVAVNVALSDFFLLKLQRNNFFYKLLHEVCSQVQKKVIVAFRVSHGF